MKEVHGAEDMLIDTCLDMLIIVDKHSTHWKLLKLHVKIIVDVVESLETKFIMN